MNSSEVRHHMQFIPKVLTGVEVNCSVHETLSLSLCFHSKFDKLSFLPSLFDCQTGTGLGSTNLTLCCFFVALIYQCFEYEECRRTIVRFLKEFGVCSKCTEVFHSCYVHHGQLSPNHQRALTYLWLPVFVHTCFVCHMISI